jgi:hypothetical protein
MRGQKARLALCKEARPIRAFRAVPLRTRPHDRCAPQNQRGPAGPGIEPPSRLSADGSENKLGEHAPQEAIAALRRDFAAEALRVAAIKVAHAADDVLLGDDVGAERGIRLAIAHLRAAAATFREMQDLIGART